MNKVIVMFFIAFALSACGGKQAEQTLTAEEENELVDEATEELNIRVDELSMQADSLNSAIDALLDTL
jgi:uncharacterized protein YcfL